MEKTIYFYKMLDYSGTYDSELSTNELAEEAYKKTPVVAMVVNRIANTAAYLKLTNEPEVFDLETRIKIYVNLLVHGEAFVLGIKPVGMKEIKKFEVLVNTHVIVQYNESSVFKDIKNYKYFTMDYQPSQILHIKFPNATSVYNKGLSPINSARDLYKAVNSINAFERHLYENRGVSGILSGTGDMVITENEREKIQNQFDAVAGGASNAGKVHISTTEVKFTPLSFKPDEMGIGESSLSKLRDVCALYNVDSSLFNDTANSTYNNVYEANKAFYNNAVFPICNLVNTQVTKFLRDNGTLVEDIAVDYEDIDALKEDAVYHSNVLSAKVNARGQYLQQLQVELNLEMITLDEMRAKLLEYDGKHF